MIREPILTGLRNTMNIFPDHDEDAVATLAYLITLTDGLVDPGETQRRAQRCYHLITTGNRRSLLMLSGLVAGFFEVLPDDDLWKQSGENTYGWTDVNISEGVSFLVHTLQVTDSLDLEQDSRGLIEVARLGWGPCFDYAKMLPNETRFDVLTGALRHVMRRTRMYIGVDVRLWEFVAYLAAAPQVDEAKFLQAVRVLAIPSGLYPAISVSLPEIPF